MLKGYKTYLLAAIAAAFAFAHVLGWISDGIYQEALTFLGIGGAITMRAALKKA